MLLIFNSASCLGTFSPSVLDFREYLVLPLDYLGFDELPRYRLIVNGIVCERRLLIDFAGLAYLLEIVEEFSSVFSGLIDMLALPILKTFDNDLSSGTSSPLLDRLVLELF